MANWAGEAELEQTDDVSTPACLACGAPLESGLVHLGSLRCLECRGSNEPLDPMLVAAWRATGAVF